MSESEQLPPCPECAEEYAYEQGGLLVCPMCGHEWDADAAVEGDDAAEASISDAVGNVLADGDTVSVVRDLKVKGGGGGTIKAGTKVKGIRLLLNAADGHDIDAKVPDFGRMQLKSSVVKKVG